VKQLQTLAKQNGISVARTKNDFIKLLDQVESGVHHGDLTGAALQAKIKQYNIAALRSKDELVSLLAEKQAAIKQAKALEEAAKNAAPQTDLSSLTVVQPKDMAKQHGVSLNLTKSEVIEMLDTLEPGVDHSGLTGKTLIAAKQKHGILPLKNEDQLVGASEKTMVRSSRKRPRRGPVENIQNLGPAAISGGARRSLLQPLVSPAFRAFCKAISPH